MISFRVDRDVSDLRGSLCMQSGGESGEMRHLEVVN